MANWNGPPQFISNEYIPRNVWPVQGQICPGVSTSVPFCGPYVLPPQSQIFRFPGSSMHSPRNSSTSGQFIAPTFFPTYVENPAVNLPVCTDNVNEANARSTKDNHDSFSGGALTRDIPLEKYLDVGSLSIGAGGTADLDHEIYMQYNCPPLPYYSAPGRNVNLGRNMACTQMNKYGVGTDWQSVPSGNVGIQGHLHMSNIQNEKVRPSSTVMQKNEEITQPVIEQVVQQGHLTTKRGRGRTQNVSFRRNMMLNSKENSIDKKKEQVKGNQNEESRSWQPTAFPRDALHGKQKKNKSDEKFALRSLMEEEKTLGRKKLLAEAGTIIQSIGSVSGCSTENSVCDSADEQQLVPNQPRCDRDDDESQMSNRSKGLSERKKVDSYVASPSSCRLYYSKPYSNKKEPSKLKSANRSNLKVDSSTHSETPENNLSVKSEDNNQTQMFAPKKFVETGRKSYKEGENVKTVLAANVMENNCSSQYMQNTEVTEVQVDDKKICEENSKEYKSTSDLCEQLVEQLTRGSYDCMVCCERVRQHNAIWSCTMCYQVFHIHCIKKWAKFSQGDGGWRCPGCQNLSAIFPNIYFCFCRKMQNPEWNRRVTPHTCGEMCGKIKTESNCPHKCLLLCHPGPCPPCDAQVTRSCSCGKVTYTVKCSHTQPVLCGEICGKMLNCGAHNCRKLCHEGPCDDCVVQIKQDCYCGKSSRVLPCLPSTTGNEDYSCERSCRKLLTCNKHYCESICHSGACDLCPQRIDVVTFCPCGKTELETLYQVKGMKPRLSCDDEIPTCEKFCSKQLPCGSGNVHICQAICHLGPCPPCPLTTVVKCRCGLKDKEIPCIDLATKKDVRKCDKRCRKKRDCGRHKCSQVCCVDQDHHCSLVCGRKLRCGLHKCEESCHRGNCPPCWRTSFEELYCYCGSTILYPPISCGTKPPECSQPCTRQQNCIHPVNHSCHFTGSCPPCTVLTEKWCYGKHELRKNIPCYLVEISCGLPCNKDLPCGQHKCNRTCHSGDCLSESSLCIQPCRKLREECGHACGLPCHDGQCPDSPCKEKVKVACACGHLTATMSCAENDKEYKRITTSLLASKMANMQAGHSIDISDVLRGSPNRKTKYRLECNEECAVIERNRRLALALQIQNPELSNKLGPPKYTTFLKDWAKKDPQFAELVHDKMTKLVQLAKESKQRSRSYSFDCMNRDKRQFIHEYSKYFGCDAMSYDQEPKRNVVATAVKDKSWLPSMGVLEVIQREMGHRKVPVPIWNTDNTHKSLVKLSFPEATVQPEKDVLPCTGTYANSVSGNGNKSSNSQEKPEVDYFDFDN